MTSAERVRHDQFLRLFIEHEEALRGFVRSLVPTLEQSREVMQEVAAVLWRKFEGLARPEEEFRPWAFGVARYEALDYLRRLRRDRHVFVLNEEVLDLLAKEAEDEATTLEAERQALQECLAKLPTARRALVEAAYAPGVRMETLAADAGRTAMSLYKALHRIRMTLLACTRQVLAREG